MPENVYYQSIFNDANQTLGDAEIAERLFLRAYYLAKDARDVAFADLCRKNAESCARQIGRPVSTIYG